MVKIQIAYLNADLAAGLEHKIGEREVAVLQHPEREIYSIEDFVIAFNEEWISDQGYIALVTHGIPISPYKQVCKNCGSEEVFRMKWVNPNTNEISSSDAGTEGLCEWCEDCKEETIIIEKGE